jgi:type I restriction enzyme S subunit
VEVRPGYKQTEVGVIPEDWEVKRIGDISTAVRGASPRPAGDPRYFNGNFIPWLTVAALTNISASQTHVRETVGYLTEEGAQHSRILEKGTLIIANSGATLGVAKILSIRCCANDGVAALLNQHDCDDLFLAYYLNSQTKRLREVVATGLGQPNLNTGLIESLSVPVPPIPEQRAIAEVLSDVDALITTLDRLIAKKRAVKQGAMQQLLTGKTRLPGFSKPWEILNIADNSTLKARIGWQGLTTAEYLEAGEYYLVTGTDFVNGRIDWERCCFVDKERYDQDRNIQLALGDILITKDGTIGKVACIDHLPGKATLNSGVFVIRPRNDNYHAPYLYHILKSSVFDAFLKQLQAGSTISHLYQKDFVGFEFLAPPMEEQRVIAAVLSDMDAEIAALEARREKTRALKQGMMQELLTGKTRLV